MIDELKSNIGNEIEMLRELSNYYRKLEIASPSEGRLLLATIDTLTLRIKMLNKSIPEILSNVSLAKPLTERKIPTNLEKIIIHNPENELRVVLNSKDKEEFIQQLRIGQGLIKRLKKKGKTDNEEYTEFKKARGYLKLSNKYFLPYAQNLIKKGYFQSLSIELRKANIDILYSTYVAMMIFTTLISFFISIFIMLFFIIFSVNISLDISEKMIEFYDGNLFQRFFKLIWIPIALPLATFGAVYFYPSTEKDTLAKKIDQELPFAAIHMSAISGSGIAPSEIFKIIGLSKEYPFLRKEIRKVMNQINLYGYDLVTSLSNVARATPSTKLAELFSGMATTITSGGDLQGFFEKRSETLLIGYRLEREKFTKIAETFMDIYISVVIAAPMILLILIVLLSITNIGLGYTKAQMTLGIIVIISLMNIIFLAFLHMKQPAY